MAYILSIDQGTSSTRSMLFDLKGHVISSSQKEHTQYYPQPGYVEHDVEEIWACTVYTITDAMKKVNATKKDILSIGITNQRETTVMWNKRTGEPYHRAIVWNDNRTQNICDRFSLTDAKYITATTGLPVSAYFSATKMMYLLECIRPLDVTNALFGTIDTYLLWRLTGGSSFLTDTTNASRTLLLNLKSLEYDEKLLNIFKIPKHMLPDVRPSGSHFGSVATSVSILGDLLGGVPITGILGDQQAALFGQSITNSGGIKVTYGTGCFILAHTGGNIITSESGLLTTVAYSIQDPTTNNVSTSYALEGSVAYGGSVIQWLRDNMQIVSSASECAELAASVTTASGVLFVPAFGGLYAPYWDSSARALIGGLTAYHTKAHICRAAIEAAAYQVTDVIAAIQHSLPYAITGLRVDGGMSVNTLLLQFQADLLGVSVSRLCIAESTALGAAMMAGVGSGALTIQQVSEMYSSSGSWEPQMGTEERAEKLKKWKFAINKSIGWKENAVAVSTTLPDQSNVPNNRFRCAAMALAMFASGMLLQARL